MAGLGANLLDGLDRDQRLLMAADLSGPVLLTGVAGTGKTCVAVYRAVRLLE